MEHAPFRDWLAARIGEGDGQVSRRELARRLAAQDPTGGDPDSYRSSLGRILSGKRNPSQRTRDAIQAALDDWSAPSVDDESADEPITREMVLEWIRETERDMRRFRRFLTNGMAIS